MKNIDVTELRDLLVNEKPEIVDVREIVEYKTGHVPTAKNIPLSEIEQRYTEISNGTYIICQSGARSSLACEYLASKGIETVNVSGGTSLWQEELEF